MHVAETLQLQHVLHADSEQIRDGHRFVDPGLRRMSQTLEDLDLPDGSCTSSPPPPGTSSTSSPTPAATPPRCTQALDQLREAYVDLYEESAAISRSSVVAAEQRLKRQKGPAAGGRAARRRPDPALASARWCRRRSAAGCARWSAGSGLNVTVAAAGLTNLEGHTEFDIVWPWTRPGGLRPGATAVLRVKDEARSLPFVLPPLLRACDHVLVVDNGSTDGTPEVDRRDRRGRPGSRTS